LLMADLCHREGAETRDEFALNQQCGARLPRLY
jgi:hypothetical protein